MKTILHYLKSTYSPKGIILYGSFADGTSTQTSDFDAIVLTEQNEAKFDNSTISGRTLDVFLYPPDTFSSSFDPEEFLQIFDGKILFDETNTLEKAKAVVLSYIENAPRRSPEERAHDIAWCEKMLIRAARGDAEGNFRHHLLLIESLSVWCTLTGRFYLGPKKSLRMMENADPASFSLYAKALSAPSLSALADWISHLRELNDTQ